MASRRDDITTDQRVQTTIEMMSPNRPHGLVTKLARTLSLSRQTLYGWAETVRASLPQLLTSKAHFLESDEQNGVGMEEQIRLIILSLTEAKVSQRNIARCITRIMGQSVSLGKVNSIIAQLEKASEAAMDHWQPQSTETLSGDEIYSNGLPNLLIIGNDSLYIHQLSRQNSCDGDTWGTFLLDAPQEVMFASDAGSGLAAGVKESGRQLHQLDWDHLLRPLWGHYARLEAQAYALLADVYARVTLFEQAYTEKRLQQHFLKWEGLVHKLDLKLDELGYYSTIVHHVDKSFAMFDFSTGLLQSPEKVTFLETLGEQLCGLSKKPIYQKLGSHLKNWATQLFQYQTPLSTALQPLSDSYHHTTITALISIWQCDVDQKRGHLSLVEKQMRQQRWQHCFEQAYRCLGETDFWAVWVQLTTILDRSWRGSMLSECVNSLLRPLLDMRKHTDQGCLNLFRFLHNVRVFKRGKRAGKSPAEMVGISLPDNPLSLLGFTK